MSVYPDASVIVAGLVPEAHSEAARAALAHAGPELVGSGWLVTEVASALALKERTGQLEHTDRLRTQEAATARLDEIRMLPVGIDHFIKASRWIAGSLKPLRAGDALHLAVASSDAAELVTLDRRLAEAGQALGLNVRLLA